MYEKLIDRSPLKLSFTNKMMTAYGGFSLLSRLIERLNLPSEIEGTLPFAEVSPNSTGVYSKILKLGLTVAAGGYRYTHAAFLGDSTDIYELTFGVKRIPKSISLKLVIRPPTSGVLQYRIAVIRVCRLSNWMT